jgi:hypothetical protein
VEHELEMDVSNDGSTHIGSHPIAKGEQRGGFCFPTKEAYSFFIDHEEEFVRDGLDLSRCIVTKGSYDTNGAIIQRQIDKRQITADVIPSLAEIKKRDPAITAFLRKVDPCALHLPSRKALKHQRFNMDARGGYRYDAGLKLRKKKDCAPIALAVAEQDFDYITSKTLCPGWSPIKHRELSCNEIYIGARNKLSDDVPKVNDKTEDAIEHLLTSRVVHMPDFHREIIVASLVDRISDEYKNRAHGALYIGNSQTRFERLRDDIEGCVSLMEGDWGRFDSCLIVIWLIIAIAALRTFDVEGTKADNYWLYVLDSVVIKDYVLLGGCIIRILNGLPSGSKATTIIGSLVNLFILCECTIAQGIRLFKCVVGGDDFLIILLEKCRADFVENFMTTAEGLGFILKDNYKFSTPNPEKLEDCCSFYKYCIFEGEPHMRKGHLLQIIFAPWEKFRYTPAGQAERILETLAAIGKPGTHCDPMYAYYVFLRDIERHGASPNINIERRVDDAQRDLRFITKEHERVYVNVCLDKNATYAERFPHMTKHTSVLSAIERRRKLFTLPVINIICLLIIDMCCDTDFISKYIRGRNFTCGGNFIDFFIAPPGIPTVDGKVKPVGRAYYKVANLFTMRNTQLLTT